MPDVPSVPDTEYVPVLPRGYYAFSGATPFPPTRFAQLSRLLGRAVQRAMRRFQRRPRPAIR